MALKGTPNRKATFGGVSFLKGTETEVREIELPVEIWKKLDDLAKVCPNLNNRTPDTYLFWVLHFFLCLCSEDQDYARGSFPSNKDT